MYAIALHSVIPVRSEAAESSEQLTQMLFAQTCDILEQQTRWTQIRLHDDGQTGWVDAKMLTPMSEQEWQQWQHVLTAERMARVAMPMAYAVSQNNGQTIPLTAGTPLPEYKNGTFAILGVAFRIDPSMVAESALEMTEEHLLNTVRFFLNIPYLWGGKNAMGMDCSGFTQVVHSLFGQRLLRNASEQVTQGEKVPSLQMAKAGDLVFFDHADQDPLRTHVSHVGILLDSARVVHCSGRVKVERIDDHGIFSMEAADATHTQGQYTHHLVQIRRYKA